MKTQIVDHEINKSKELLAKTRYLLERKLIKATQVDDRLEDIQARLENDEISPVEYEMLSKQIRKDDVSVAVLTSLSKELFTQSRIEEGKDPEKPESAEEARMKLEKLLQAVNDKDEQTIIGLIFPDAQPIPISD